MYHTYQVPPRPQMQWKARLGVQKNHPQTLVNSLNTVFVADAHGVTGAALQGIVEVVLGNGEGGGRNVFVSPQARRFIACLR